MGAGYKTARRALDAETDQRQEFWRITASIRSDGKSFSRGTATSIRSDGKSFSRGHSYFDPETLERWEAE
jgi:hypothetical protein